MSDPWEAWGQLAGLPWQHELSVPGAELLAEDNSLDEENVSGTEGQGTYVWAREAVYRQPNGCHLFARAERRPDTPDQLQFVHGGPDSLAFAKAVRAQLGMTPGRVEVLGRAGIEIGLEPDDGEED
ncbi:MAG: hypothetical protein JKY65_16165 [Planctomycetes bacterium]|nr:hypothetical protein [Planctomycetota bacterium]